MQIVQVYRHRPL